MDFLCPSDLKRVFEKFDTNGDGKISANEFNAAMCRLGQPPTSEEELHMMVQAIDCDGDGLVDFIEFVNYFTKVVDDGVALIELEQAFGVFDLDGDGVIKAEELQMALINFGEEVSMKQCMRMIEVFDCDGDGCIDFNEFMIMMCSKDLRTESEVTFVDLK